MFHVEQNPSEEIPNEGSLERLPYLHETGSSHRTIVPRGTVRCLVRRPRLNVPRETVLPGTKRVQRVLRKRGKSEAGISRRGARVGNEVFHVEHSLERSASASAVGTRIPKSLCNISETGRGSGISSSHKEEASQRIRHGDWLTPFPSRNLQYLR